MLANLAIVTRGTENGLLTPTGHRARATAPCFLPTSLAGQAHPDHPSPVFGCGQIWDKGPSNQTIPKVSKMKNAAP